MRRLWADERRAPSNWGVGFHLFMAADAMGGLGGRDLKIAAGSHGDRLSPSESGRAVTQGELRCIMPSGLLFGQLQALGPGKTRPLAANPAPSAFGTIERGQIASLARVFVSAEEE